MAKKCWVPCSRARWVIKIVNEELIRLMGSDTTEIALKPTNDITVIMMQVLQGAGKTDNDSRDRRKAEGKGPQARFWLPVTYTVRQQSSSSRSTETNRAFRSSPWEKNQSPVNIAKASLWSNAAKNGYNVVILDTAGRLHVDEGMMEELENIKEAVNVDQTILVVDAMTGQDAVQCSIEFPG